MVSYPIELVEEDDGTYRVASPHFPELVTYGESEPDALMHALYALEEVITQRIAKREVVPVPIKPAPDLQPVELPKQIAGLLELYWRYNLGAFAPERPE